VHGRLCRCTVSRTAQTVGCDAQWQGENYRDIATLQRSAAFKTLASPLLEGHERAQQPSPPDIVWALSTAAFAARCLHVVSDLGVADRIGDQPVRIGELASSCGVDPDGLDRVLRLFTTHGIFQRQHGSYGHTPSSLLLRSDHPMTMRAFPQMMGMPLKWGSLTEFKHSS
jgi:hypothetical protein